MKRRLRIVLYFLAVTAVFLPPVYWRVRSQAPYFVDSDGDVVVENGSGYQRVNRPPADFPLAYYIVSILGVIGLWKEWGRRPNPSWKIPFPNVALLCLAIAWLPMVIFLHGANAIGDRIRLALTVVFLLFIPSAAIFGMHRMTGWISNAPDRLREQRLAKGLCVGCGYSLMGNVSGVCPECGKKA